MKYQVVILAGGKSSRFFPFNKLHKSFFKIGGKSILERTVSTVKKSDPLEILLVLGGKNFEEEKAYCEALSAFENVKIIRQENSLGQADAILAAEKFIKNDFFVINSQQFDLDKITTQFIEKKESNSSLVTIGLAETDCPNKYGIASIDGEKVTGVTEKPEKGREASNLRLVGIYLFSKEFLHELKKREISEYLLEVVLNEIAGQGKVSFVEIKETLPSLKYPWDVLDVKNAILNNVGFGVDKSAAVAPTAILKGDSIHIGKNAFISDFAIIESPAYIGDNAVVGAYCQMRGGSILEDGAQIERYTDVKNSIIGDGSHIHSGFVGDSVIGRDCRIGAGFVTANKKFDRSSIDVDVKNNKVDSYKKNIGAFIGDNVKVGIRVSTMPGTVVGPNSTIYPGVILKGCIETASDIAK